MNNKEKYWLVKIANFGEVDSQLRRTAALDQIDSDYSGWRNKIDKSHLTRRGGYLVDAPDIPGNESFFSTNDAGERVAQRVPFASVIPHGGFAENKHMGMVRPQVDGKWKTWDNKDLSNLQVPRYTWDESGKPMKSTDGSVVSYSGGPSSWQLKRFHDKDFKYDQAPALVNLDPFGNPLPAGETIPPPPADVVPGRPPQGPARPAPARPAPPRRPAPHGSSRRPKTNEQIRAERDAHIEGKGLTGHAPPAPASPPPRPVTTP